MMKRILLNWTMLMISISLVNTKAPTKIINGDVIDPLDHPYQVSIRVQNVHICVGVIMSKYRTITSATCVTFGGESNIIHGNMVIYISDDIFYPVSYAALHPEFKARRFFANDVCILKTYPIITFSTSSSIEIQSTIPRTLNNGEVIGWGSDHRFRQKLNVVFLKRHRCLFYYEMFGGIHNTQSRVSPVSKISHINQGDSGSPVVLPFPFEYRLQGIVSVVSVHSHYPIIYTKVSLYTDWIDSMAF